MLVSLSQETPTAPFQGPQGRDLLTVLRSVSHFPQSQLPKAWPVLSEFLQRGEITGYFALVIRMTMAVNVLSPAVLQRFMLLWILTSVLFCQTDAPFRALCQLVEAVVNTPAAEATKQDRTRTFLRLSREYIDKLCLTQQDICVARTVHDPMVPSTSCVAMPNTGGMLATFQKLEKSLAHHNGIPRVLL